jgi:hypothetical protein
MEKIMTETKNKRGRGRPKKTKVVEQPKITEEITMEDIKSVMEEIVNERLTEEGILKGSNPNEEINEGFDVSSDVYTTNIPIEWCSMFNILTRMYETNEEEYVNVKFNENKKTLLVDLDEKIYKSVQSEISKIKVVSGYSSLKYSGTTENGRLLITISM